MSATNTTLGRRSSLRASMIMSCMAITSCARTGDEVDESDALAWDAGSAPEQAKLDAQAGDELAMLDAGAGKLSPAPIASESAGLDEPAQSAPDEWVKVMYRGQPRLAERYGTTLVVEGDIQVDAKDILSNDEASEPGKGGIQLMSAYRSGTNGGGNNYKWPGGVIPYTFDTSVTSVIPPPGKPSHQQVFEDQMEAWSNVAPGIHFRPYQPGDTDYITFYITADGACGNSIVGRRGNQQFVNVKESCFKVHTALHEVGHAMGLEHEHQRADAADNLIIHWDHMVGCPSTATSSADCSDANCALNALDCGCTDDQVKNGNCQTKGNLAVESSDKPIGPYDVDSIMQYDSFMASKCVDKNDNVVLCSDPHDHNLPTLLRLDGSIIPKGGMSAGDIAGINVLYPITTIQTSLFARTGPQTACRLSGREEDDATSFELTGFPSGSTPQSNTTPDRGVFHGNVVDTDQLGTGDYTVRCNTWSLFWEAGYGYPNHSKFLNITAASPGELETSTESASVRLMDPGLIAVLF